MNIKCNGTGGRETFIDVDPNLFSENVSGELTLELNNLWSSLQDVPTFISDIASALKKIEPVDEEMA